MGVLNLSLDEFHRMTLFEYRMKCQGFNEHNQKMMIQNAWLTGLAVGRVFSVSEKNPYPSLDEFTAELTTPPETDEDLFKIAKEKGIEVPEGM
jgi:hypothetical protein